VKIAISGASGLLGSALVPELRERGHDVLRLVRREARTLDEVEWDPASGKIDRARLVGVNGFVNLSGATLDKRWTEKRKREIVESRIGTTSLLATTAAALDPRPTVFVKTGGSGIYGDRGDEILTEESVPGSGFLAELAEQWETAARPAHDAGVRVVHFRQGMVLTPEGGALPRMLPFFKLGLGGPVGGGAQWWSWVSITDLVSAYAFVLENDVSGAVNLTAPNPVTSRQFARALGRAVRRPAVLPAPAFGIKLLWGQMGEEVLLFGQRSLPARLLDAGFMFRYPRLDAALAHALATERADAA
jgi:uncharacterized protein (TIGR01777 family)